jgi:hypothetical protein
LLIDLNHKVQSLNASLPGNHYNGDIFTFDIIDRVIVEAYAFLKADVSIFGALDTIRRRLMLVNAEKQKLLTILAMSYRLEDKNAEINRYRQTVGNNVSEVTILAEQIES